MVIKQLILYKYQRLTLNAIEYLELNPKHKIQLILGTNGSGKSSLLSQMNPLPGIASDFLKEGYKSITIEHQQSTYVLKSLFITGGNRFEFIKDGEELNKGGTISVYRDLVKQFFGITPEVQDLLSGTMLFHQMSSAERRKWLTIISESDYTYAFKYFNGLKEQLRELQSTYKLNQSRLVQEKNKILSEEQDRQYRESIDELRILINHLLELKQPLINIANVKSEHQSLQEQLIKKTTLVDTLKQQLYIRHFTIDSIDEIIINNKSKEQAAHNQSLLLFNTIQQLEDQARTLTATHATSYESIDSQIESIQLKQQDIISKKSLLLTWDDPQVAYNAIVTLQEQLVVIFSELPDNSNGQYSTQAYESLDKQYREHEIKLQQIQHEIGNHLKLKQNLEHARDHQQQSCPKCSHVWSKGYDDNTYNDVINSITVLSGKADQLIAEMKILTESLDAHRERLSSIKQFRLLSYNWNVLEPLWTYMASEDMLSVQPKRVITLVDQVIKDLQLDILYKEHQQQINELIKLKLMTHEHQTLDLDKIKASIELYQQELYQLGSVIKDAKANVTHLENQKKVITQLKSLEIELSKHLSDREQVISQMRLSLQQQALNDTIRLLQLELNEKEQIISKVDIQKGIIEHLELVLEEYQSKQHLIKIAIKELSPTEGLIARGLTLFINHFVKQINHFISQVWLYPLELVPILPNDNDEVDLDYKFAVKINDTKEITDITKGSTAMKEVIDLAFRIVSMSYLGLHDYPIAVDEIGHSFDKAHRQAVFQVINNLLTSSSFSQIFMVSHYHEMHGSLTDCDVSVLSASNISLPANAAINSCLILR